MQDAKDLAFLMHPNHRTDATEGSRTARGQAAGCIKKAPAEAGASRGDGGEGIKEEHGSDTQAPIGIGQGTAHGIDAAGQGADLAGKSSGCQSACRPGRVVGVSARTQDWRVVGGEVASARGKRGERVPAGSFGGVLRLDTGVESGWL